ncbi:MAG: helix-turn-helix domain-containing protein [Patescibacteria group bacterium]
MTQKQALEILKMGHNAFITGAAGSGKTHLLNEYVKYLKARGVLMGVTASTGVAATHMNGMTIHAWSGLGIRDKLSKHDLDNLVKKSYLRQRLDQAKVLVIDEISMLHHFRLDLIDKIIRAFKRVDAPFGGLQVILCGDFFQLPPVSRGGEDPARFAYHSPAWENLNLKICYLDEQHRQSDIEFIEVLNGIRDDKISDSIFGRLKSCFGKKTEIGIEPTKIYSHNVNVDAENERELAKITGEIFEYKMSGRGRGNLTEILKKTCLAPDILRLKVGARVMFVKNNFEAGYANGTLGAVVDCDDFGIRVKTVSGKVIEVEKANWMIEDCGEAIARITQYPLRLAWAITVHKSQGMSLDAAQIDLSQSFERGMGYVALSRVRSLAGLSLLGLNDMALKVNEEVMEYDKKFRADSLNHGEELGSLSLAEISAAQKNFLEKIGAGQPKIKKEKVDTEKETKKFLLAGRSIEEIAKARGLKTGTIISHLEKIKSRDPRFDFSFLANGIPTAQLEKIIKALPRGFGEGGVFRLAPVKEFLGEKFSYEEIRIARLIY